MRTPLKDGSILTDDQRFLLFNKETPLCGITTNRFGDCSYIDPVFEELQSEFLQKILGAGCYHKLKAQHKDNIVYLNYGQLNSSSHHEADAIMCPADGEPVALFSNTADCATITLTDMDQKFLAIIHSGRAGTNLNIVGKTIDLIQHNFPDVYPGRMLAWFWPGLRDNLNTISDQDPHLTNLWDWYHKGLLHLKIAITCQLSEAGLLGKNIKIVDCYTDSIIGDDTSFYSYRLKQDYRRNTVFITNNQSSL
ncbi:MAG: laccase domain-containing protein [Candidatus Falkowbacteria bacterium]